MRYSKQISTGLLIESQSGGDPQNPTYLQTLVDNAVNWGIPVDDIETGYCTDAEHQTMLDAKDIAIDLANPLKKWERDIAQTDSGMPRYLEDLITSNSSLVIPTEMKKHYDLKIKIRGERP